MDDWSCLVFCVRVGEFESLLETLSREVFALGIDQLAVLIRESPAADHLLPLTTALELEMGEEPQVAIEVRRVAEDMQQELAKIRELFRKAEGNA